MKRWIAVGISFGMTVTGLLRAEDVEWRKVGSPPKPKGDQAVQQTTHDDLKTPITDVPKFITPLTNSVEKSQAPAEVVAPSNQKSTSSVPAIVGQVLPPCNNCCPPVIDTN